MKRMFGVSGLGYMPLKAGIRFHEGIGSMRDNIGSMRHNRVP